VATAKEIREVARERLGRTLAFGGFREFGLLARLMRPGETIGAMALGRVRGAGLVGSQRLAVGTPDRLLLIEKGFFTGRERIQEIAWSTVEAVEVHPPMRMDLVLTDGRVELSLLQPPRQLGELADFARTRIDPSRATLPTSAELADLARRKLGRMHALGHEPHVLALAGTLNAGENVLDLAIVAGRPSGLLAATTHRLVFVASRGLGVGETASVDYVDVGGIEHGDEGDLAVRRPGEALTLHAVVPRDRAEAIVRLALARAVPR